MILSTDKRGFYTVEAAIVLPLVILAIISIGYFMRVYSIWENCMHGALDESAYTAAVYSDGFSKPLGKARVKDRLTSDNPRLSDLEIKNYLVSYSDFTSDELISFSYIARTDLALPIDFGDEFSFEGGVKYRGFCGSKNRGDGMGPEALETDELRDPVYIFPQYGEKYHSKNCTYVQASVKAYVLTNKLKRQYGACGLCGSGDIKTGGIVFCFSGEDTAYHYGNCRSIQRHPAICNRTEAIKRGYTECSKCGGN